MRQQPIPNSVFHHTIVWKRQLLDGVATKLESAKRSVPSTRCLLACRRAFSVRHFASSARLVGRSRCGPVIASEPDQQYFPGHESSQAA